DSSRARSSWPRSPLWDSRPARHRHPRKHPAAEHRHPTGMSPSSQSLERPVDGLPNFTHQQIVSVLVGIMLCIVLSAVDITVGGPAGPAISADLHCFRHLSWIVSAYLITSTAAMPIYAKLSDIYGRRLLLMVAI